MITKHELRRCRNMKLQALSIREQLQELRAAMTAPKTSKFSSIPCGYGGSDSFIDTMDKIDKLRKRYREKYSELLDFQMDIEDEIDKLSEEEQALLRWYYFAGCTWEQTAERLHYSRSQIYRKHNEILEKLAPEPKHETE